MADFFPRAWESLGPRFDIRVRQVWAFLETLFGAPVGGPEAFRHLPAVDEVISLVDACLAEGKGLGPRYPPLRLQRVQVALQHLLCAALDASAGPAGQQGPHARFVRQLCGNSEPAGLISLNYDTLLDRALIAAGHRLDYGFGRADWRPSLQPERGSRTCLLAKLHGSLNWALCPACDHISVLEERVAHLLPAMQLRCRSCGSARLQGVIVTPSLRKRYQSVQLKHVWSLAFDMLTRAERVVLVGYSLPPADLPVLQLILRATLAGGRRPHILVVNRRDPSLPEQARRFRERSLVDRFRRLFGPSVQFDFAGFRGEIKF